MRADARVNRERLLRSAETLFTQRGLEASLDQIARHAGLGPGTIHRHFPTKDSLIAAVAIRQLDALVVAAEQRTQDRDPAQALRDQLLQMIAAGDEHAPLKQAIAGRPDDVAWSESDVSRRLHAVVGDLLVRAQAADTVRAELGADDLIALIAGAHAAIQRAGVRADSARGRRLTDTILRGIGLLD